MPVAASGGKSGAIRAGEAFVEVSARDRLTPFLNKAQARLAAFGAFTNKLGSSALRAGSVLLAPVAALFAGTLANAKAGVFGSQAQQHALRFTLAWERAILSLQEGLLPVLEIILPFMQQLSILAKQNKGIVQVIALVAVSLIGLGIALKAFAVVAGVVSIGIGAIKLALLVLSSPLLLVAGLIIGFAAAMTDWGSLFRTLGDTGKQVIGGILAALRSGQIELAFKIALVGLKLAWHDTIAFFKQELGGLVSVLGDIAKMVVILKAVQSGASIGSLFGPLGTIVGAAVGGGAAALAIHEIDKAVEALLPSANPADRAKLAAELAGLIAKAQVGGAGGGARIQPLEAAKGLFQSPNFQRALGFGDTVAQRSLAVQERMAENLASIDDRLADVPLARFA